jgi:L-lactate dehydrogenase (cytochrome)
MYGADKQRSHSQSTMAVASPIDFRIAASRRLPRFLFDYIEGGANDELTLARNISQLSNVNLTQRVLKDVSDIQLGCDLFGTKLSMPVVLGPVGLLGMYARRGEVQAGRAAASKNVPFCLSTVSICSIEEVVRHCSVPPWFQLYVLRDRGFMHAILEKAQAAGSKTLVFTVDVPVQGLRYRDLRSGLTGSYAPLRRFLQAVARPSWAWNVGVRGRPHSLGTVGSVLGRQAALKDFVNWAVDNLDPSVQWRDLEWVRRTWKGPLIIKGILHPDDAREAHALGVDGIVVSNHGGRQLDGAISTAAALPVIANAVGDKLTILADSGIRSGLDIIRMLALGAKGVLLGRAYVYALAARGQRGVVDLLGMIERELRVGMAMTGVRTLSEIDRSILAETICR